MDLQKFYDSKETRYLTHNFHPYPNKFIPQIAKAIIKEYTKKDDIVLDPFVGSGTSLIEANLLKRNCIGIDLNPLACLISRVKTTPLEIRKLKDVAKTLLEDSYSNLSRDGSLRDFTDKLNPEIPCFPKREYWFKKNALIGLSVLKELINRIEDVKIKDFCLVGFSSIIKEVSNASSMYRLTRLKKPRSISEIYVAYRFKEKIDQMIEGLNVYNSNVNPNFIEVHQRDSRHLCDISADFVIANPPSFNFDFSRCFSIYFWWLDFGSTKNLQIAFNDSESPEDTSRYVEKLDSALIGTKKVNLKLISLGIDFADDLISQVKEKRPRIAVSLSKYYHDIRQVLTQVHRLLKEDKYCCINVSDRVLYGSQMKVPDTIVELANQAGFKLDKVIKRVVPKKAFLFASKDKVEEFLIFQKA